MGGNLVTKYLGEPRVKPPNVIGGISVCQGYDANMCVCTDLKVGSYRTLRIRFLRALIYTAR